jgi:Thioredoxin
MTMITQEQFDTGLRLDQYIASIAQNKENFRANFIKAIEAYSPDDILFFRSLPQKIRVAVVTADDNPDALRDVPLIGRISVEVGRVMLRMFRPDEHPQLVQSLAEALDALEAGRVRLPVIAFFSEEMRLLGVHVRRIAELDLDMQQRRQAWVEAHPEVADAGKSLIEMSPITRTRMIQALFSLTSEQRLHWARRTVSAWRGLLAPLFPPTVAPALPVAPAHEPEVASPVDKADSPNAATSPDRS